MAPRRLHIQSKRPSLTLQVNGIVSKTFKAKSPAAPTSAQFVVADHCKAGAHSFMMGVCRHCQYNCPHDGEMDINPHFALSRCILCNFVVEDTNSDDDTTQVLENTGCEEVDFMPMAGAISLLERKIIRREGVVTGMLLKPTKREDMLARLMRELTVLKTKREEIIVDYNAFNCENGDHQLRDGKCLFCNALVYTFE